MKINKILSMLFAGTLLLGAPACTDEVEYTPASPAGGNGVYLPVDASDEVDIENNATSCAVSICRENAGEVLTVDIQASVTDPEGNAVTNIFTLPTSVTFAEDATVVPYTIGVNFANVVPETNYTLHLKIVGEDNSLFGLVERNFILSYAPWSDWKPYRYYPETGAMVPVAHENFDKEGVTGNSTLTLDNLWAGTFEVPTYVRGSLVNSSKFQIMVPDPFTWEEYGADPEFNPIEDAIFHFIVSYDESLIDEATGFPVASLQIFNTTVDQGAGDFYCADVATWAKDWWMGGTITLEQAIEGVVIYNNMTVPFYNTEKGLFALNTILFTEDQKGTGGHYGAPSMEYLQLPGFKDYEVTMSKSGNFVDGDGVEYAVVQAYKGEDAYSFSYGIAEGALDKTQVAEFAEQIKSDTEATLIYSSSATLSFKLDKAGFYTVVAVSYNNAGEAVATSSCTFEYESVQKEKVWESIGFCQYTDGLIYGHWSIKGYGPIGGDDWAVEVERHKTEEGLYRLVNPYKNWPFHAVAAQLGGNTTMSGNYYIEFVVKPGEIYMKNAELGVDFTDLGLAPLSIQSDTYYLIQEGVEPALLAQAGYMGNNDNGVITFPAGLFGLFAGNSGYYTNYNETLENALSQIQSQEEFNAFWDNYNPLQWGMGYTTIDMSALTQASAPAKAVKISKEVSRAGLSGMQPVHSAFKASDKHRKISGVKTSVTKAYKASHTRIPARQDGERLKASTFERR